MSDPGAAGYALVFLAAALSTSILVPMMLRLAVAKGILDHPGGYKHQKAPTPYLGGAAIAIGFCGSIAAAVLLRPPVARTTEVWVILGVAASLSLIGLLDDLRSLPLWPRLVTVIVGGLVLYLAGVRTELADGGQIDVLVTLLWIVGITNAMNLLDNMDGLSAGIAGIVAATFGVLAAAGGQFLVAALAAGLAGTCVAFLRHNRPPARIYMGDAGSLFLGVMLAVLGMKLRFPQAPPSIAALVPILALAVPITDTTIVVIARLASGRNPFLGGRDHISHRLVHVGVSERAAVALLYGAAAATGALAVVMARLRDVGTAYLLFGIVVTAIVFIGVMIGTVPVYGQQRSHLRMTAADPAAAGQPKAPRERVSQDGGAELS